MSSEQETPRGGGDIRESVNRISERQGFAAGDPRAGPFDQNQVDEARDFLDADDRRSTHVGLDLYAMRLQYGRGLGRRRTAAMFGVSESMIAFRKDMSGPRKWIEHMSDRDRRNLSRLVWLGGLLRQAGDPDEAELKTLRAASEWKHVDDEEKRIWLPQDENGEAQPMRIHEEIADDDYYSERDPYRDERIAVLAKLEAELDAVDALRDEDEDPLGEGAGEIPEAAEASAGNEGVP